ncbi:MAG: radical SAM protein [Leptospirales bacterium]
MKLLLISPIFKPDKRMPEATSVSAISLNIIAGLTPPDVEVKIIEEEIAMVNPDEEDADLVGISCMTSNVMRGYAIADAFRKRGITVILGGIHPSLLPDEAAQHCDSLCVGEVENVWEQMLEDFKNKKLKKRYSSPYPDLQRFIPLKGRNLTRKIGMAAVALETTRGCPFTCNFCTVPVHFGRKQRHRPVEHVVQMIEDAVKVGIKRVFFMDDNILGTPSYARKLLKAIAPLKISWSAQSTLKTLEKNPDLMDLSRKSGSVGFFFGIESVGSAMGTFTKSYNSQQALVDGMNRVRDAGLHVHAALIFGFDQDTEAVFDETLEFLLKHKIPSASFHPLTPYPGTALFKQLDEENRLLSKDWNDYHYYWGTIVYQPKNFSPQKLFLETARVQEEFSRFSNVIKGTWVNRKHPLLPHFFNYGLNKTIKLARANWLEHYGNK